MSPSGALPRPLASLLAVTTCFFCLARGNLALRAVLDEFHIPSGFCGEPGVKSFTGYVTVGKPDPTLRPLSPISDKNYFYWFFESQGTPADDPFIIWLTGGPGCSSTLALLAENGPCTVQADGDGGVKTVTNPYSWNKKANVMWIDQPAGVGYSYGNDGDYDHDESGVSEDLYWFLQQFMKDHSIYVDNPLFVFGESYGGHYVPAVSNRIYRGNLQRDRAASLRSRTLHINLQGIGIGNGLTDPLEQYKWYPAMAVNNTYGVKAVDDVTYLHMLAHVGECVDAIQACQDDDGVCATAQTVCETHITTPYYDSGLNPYDIRKECGENDLCYDFTAITSFLQSELTRKVLGVSERSAPWVSCNNKVNSMFSGDWMKNFHRLLVPMLEHGIPVLIYAGDCDFICNWMGNKAWTLNLDWSGKRDFNDAKDEPWSADGGNSQAGLIRSANGLTFLQVFEAGHMVPMDQAEASLELLYSFTLGKPWGNVSKSEDVVVDYEEDADSRQEEEEEEEKKKKKVDVIDAAGGIAIA